MDIAITAVNYVLVTTQHIKKQGRCPHVFATAKIAALMDAIENHKVMDTVRDIITDLCVTGMHSQALDVALLAEHEN